MNPMSQWLNQGAMGAGVGGRSRNALRVSLHGRPERKTKTAPNGPRRQGHGRGGVCHQSGAGRYSCLDLPGRATRRWRENGGADRARSNHKGGGPRGKISSRGNAVSPHRTSSRSGHVSPRRDSRWSMPGSSARPPKAG